MHLTRSVKKKSGVSRAITFFTVAFLCYTVFYVWFVFFFFTLGRAGSGSGRNLWVSGLSSSTRATDLKNLFSKYGKVHSRYVN